MKRIDPVYGELQARIEGEDLTPEEMRKCALEMKNREAYLKPAYHVVSLVLH